MNNFQLSIRELCVYIACIAITLACVVSDSEAGFVVMCAACGIALILILAVSPRSFMISYGIAFMVVAAAIILLDQLATPAVSNLLHYRMLPPMSFNSSGNDVGTVADENRKVTLIIGLVIWIPFVVARVRWGIKGNEDSI
ncbi:hypothetical protein C5Y96_23815 [Blastopirellula marina]|uniref:Uncharacterized protein n=1 Tax=Blastopirellula marina TaxID=124 RepID=A0A2S8EZS3_9BACT|nr:MULTISPECIES: hypothetical protein [Pirellulaceae]PQO25371.1 hypothetical protein C5Y96_23815 [Blastopirellula marina]RCS42335.1 hypothetical protein DTL36_23865 [Bremerella cremea]